MSSRPGTRTSARLAAKSAKDQHRAEQTTMNSNPNPNANRAVQAEVPATNSQINAPDVQDQPASAQNQTATVQENATHVNPAGVPVEATNVQDEPTNVQDANIQAGVIVKEEEDPRPFRPLPKKRQFTGPIGGSILKKVRVAPPHCWRLTEDEFRMEQGLAAFAPIYPEIPLMPSSSVVMQQGQAAPAPAPPEQHSNRSNSPGISAQQDLQPEMIATLDRMALAVPPSPDGADGTLRLHSHDIVATDSVRELILHRRHLDMNEDSSSVLLFVHAGHADWRDAESSLERSLRRIDICQSPTCGRINLRIQKRTNSRCLRCRDEIAPFSGTVCLTWP